jgi:hypothetical protein
MTNQNSPKKTEKNDKRREEDADEGGEEEEDALCLELLLLLLLPGYRFHGFCSVCQDTTISAPVRKSDQHTIVPAGKQASKQASKQAGDFSCCCKAWQQTVV